MAGARSPTRAGDVTDSKAIPQAVDDYVVESRFQCYEDLTICLPIDLQRRSHRLSLIYRADIACLATQGTNNVQIYP